MIELTKETYDQEIQSGAVLVDFWAEWCGPCKMLAPELDKFEAEHGGGVKVCKVNVDSERELAMKYGVMSIPTVFVYRDGTLDKKLIGFRDAATIAEELGL